jgi:hypothetical protein
MRSRPSEPLANKYPPLALAPSRAVDGEASVPPSGKVDEWIWLVKLLQEMPILVIGQAECARRLGLVTTRVGQRILNELLLEADFRWPRPRSMCRYI